MTINNNGLNMSTQIQPGQSNIKPQKIEVVVGALTEHDVKDHGTATGVAKTVNWQKSKIKPRKMTEVEDAAKADRVTNADKAREAMGVIRRVITQTPSEMLSAQANQVRSDALHLLR